MNATIHGIIDTMFKDTVNTAETRALHEELLNNCLEHYDDLISRGLSETEAIDAVVESLKGMQEVIDEYPKKPGAEKKEEIPAEPAAEPAAAPEKPVEENSRDRVYNPADIRKINTELKDGDLTVTPSADGMIHVRCEQPETVVCLAAGTSLTIRAAHPAAKKPPKVTLDSGEVNLKGLLEYVGKTLENVASNFVSQTSDVDLELPEAWIAEMNLTAMSGDIRLKGCGADKLAVHSTSGDLEITLPAGHRSGDINAGTMSGDIDFKGNANEAVFASMSGDVTAEGEFINARIKSTSGDARLNGCARDVRAHSVSGDARIVLKNADARNIDAASTSGDVEIYVPDEVPGIHAQMTTVSGSTRCRFADAGSAAALKISAKSVSGDVRIG